MKQALFGTAIWVLIVHSITACAYNASFEVTEAIVEELREPNVAIHCRQNKGTNAWVCEGTFTQPNGNIITTSLFGEKPIGLFLGCEARGKVLVAHVEFRQNTEAGEPRVTMSNERCLSKTLPVASKQTHGHLHSSPSSSQIFKNP